MLIDTDVFVEFFRGHAPVLAWFSSLGATPIALPGLVAMEILQGCRNLVEQQQIEMVLAISRGL